MTQDLIAFSGILKLELAIWDTRYGMYTKFKIDQSPQDENNPNPFKRFTQMRNNKVGTIFKAVFTRVSDQSVAWDDEVMLKGWNDGTTGWAVTLWHESTDGAVGVHPFMEFDKGEEFAVVLVELADDSSAINQKKRAAAESAPKQRSEMKLSNYAASLCRNENFHRFLREAHGIQIASGMEVDGAARWMRNTLQAESRSVLDTDPAKAGRFHNLIRIPFGKWCQANGL